MIKITREQVGLVLMGGMILSAVILVFMQAPLAQDPRYHAFTDVRSAWFVPNFLNVVTSLLYTLVGLLGMYKLINAERMVILQAFRPAYLLFFIGVALVGPGSAYYHLSPDNASLVWDRLAMTIAFMAFFSIMISEFISIKVARMILPPLLLCGTVSVVYWAMSELRGEGDLRPYVLIQFVPVLCMPVILLFFRSRFSHVKAYWGLFAAYALAKVFEAFDSEVYELLGFISGHSLKHIASALGVYILLRSFEKRELTR